MLMESGVAICAPDRNAGGGYGRPYCFPSSKRHTLFLEDPPSLANVKEGGIEAHVSLSVDHLF
ncbi:hypothetical protein BN873_150102 [Candidatus Competibacter denitrificans Run_A_D11]|uniref:Uncharacterized protein n=1 Tax=Candidatus Competibacter denitrificans Run_A_D11 TaxID=1400863 RepID=W6M442_9GAMM|nr:hypothetical protein BN873_150102 [Candidatus Competibacter denitrificans Run_A_D11]